MNIDLTTDLSNTRNQLHWSAQLLSAAADATMEKAADDSHSHLGWDSGSGHLVGRCQSPSLDWSGCRLRLFPLSHLRQQTKAGLTNAVGCEYLTGQ